MADHSLLEALRRPSSPPRLREPSTSLDGWMVSTASTTSAFKLVDLSSLAKLEVQAEPDGPLGQRLGVAAGRAELFEGGILAASTEPGRWLIVASGSVDGVLSLLSAAAAEELVTIVDMTHGQAAFRLIGAPAVDVLAGVADLDGRDRVFPLGTAVRARLGGLPGVVVRDDVYADEAGLGGDPDEEVVSFLLLCERSGAPWLAEHLLDAGRPHGLEEEGYASYRSRRSEV